MTQEQHDYEMHCAAQAQYDYEMGCAAQAQAEYEAQMAYYVYLNGLFKLYRKRNFAEMRPYIVGEALSDSVSISKADIESGSPKDGDMIARNPENHSDQWLVSKEFFEDNYTLA